MNKVLKLKEKIKELSEEQKQLRLERKSSYEGERKYSEDGKWYPAHVHAWMDHQYNREELRHMFYLYDILRDKEPIPPKHKKIWLDKVEELEKELI